MTVSSPDTPHLDVPEADWVEQAAEADPLAEDEEELPQPAYIGRGLREVDDADLAEQETVVYVDDEDSRG
jgi:hypothetical protein